MVFFMIIGIFLKKDVSLSCLFEKGGINFVGYKMIKVYYVY